MPIELDELPGTFGLVAPGAAAVEPAVPGGGVIPVDVGDCVPVGDVLVGAGVLTLDGVAELDGVALELPPDVCAYAPHVNAAAHANATILYCIFISFSWCDDQ